MSSTETPVQTLGEAVADAHGQWSLQLAKNLDQGRHFVTAQQFFDSRNSASTPERGFDVVDIEVFPALIESPADNVQTGIRPVITGTGIPGATVTLLEYNQPNSPLATTVVDGYGKWSVQIDNPLPARTFRLTGYQVIDGKRSDYILDHPIQVVDTPAPPQILTPAMNIQTGLRPVVTGTGIAGATVTLLEYNQPNSPLATAVVGGDGTWSVQIDKPLPARTFRLTGYQVIDGKKSDYILDHPIQVVDTPAPPQILTPAMNIQTGLRPVVTGTGIPGATVTLLEYNQPNSPLATTVVDGYGKWSVQIDNPLPARTFRLTGYQVIDGKKSDYILDHPIQVVDTPAPPQILTPAMNIQTGLRPVVTGTGIPGATVTLLEYNQPNSPLATTVVDGYGKWSVQIDNPLPARTFRLTGYQVIDGKRSDYILDHPIQVVDTIP
ncbi:hypothetical protein [Pseudomonas mandelii]